MFSKLGRNDMCWCGSGLKYKNCHYIMDDKISMFKNQGHIVPKRKLIKTEEQIKGIRESGKINIAILDYITDHIRIGMTTEEIDKLVQSKTKEYGGIPAPLNFEGYPKNVCVSINDEVCHGIPSDKVLLCDGDIVNVDVSTIYKGYFSDSSRMFCMGNVSEEKKKLVEVAKKSIDIGLREIKPWSFLGDMGQAIHDFVKGNGYSVVEVIGGHGVGLEFHEEPYVSYISKRGTEMLLVPGMVFTIEPMINRGTPDVFTDDNNGWTVYTEDKEPSAQWEVTVAVTKDGYEILAY